MKFDHRVMARKQVAGALLSACAIASLTAQAAAQSPPAAPAQAAPAAAKPAAAKQAAAKPNSDAALKAYSAGTRAYESGKMADAVSELSTALSAGGLPSNQMAKALYYRGAAYRKQGKPAMAISDLTSALWLKGGLNDSDRAQAVDARQAAYREAGLGETAPPVPVQQAAVAAPAAPAAAAPAAAAPAAPVQVAASEPIATLAGTPDAAAAVARTRPTLTAVPADGSLSSAVAIPGESTASAPAAPAAAPVEPPVVVAAAPVAAPAPDAVQLNAAAAQDTATPSTPSPLAGAGQAVTGFFNTMGSSIGKIFGGGGEQPSAGAQATLTESSPVMTSSTAPVYAPSAQPAAAQPSAGQAGWEQAMVVSPSKGAGSKPAKVTAPAPKAASGTIRLQVAAVRSRAEAEQVSAKLLATPVVQSAAATPVIDEAVLGSLGTFYRVRLGPFANAAEPNKLCAALKPQGYDCLVVAQ